MEKQLTIKEKRKKNIALRKKFLNKFYVKQELINLSKDKLKIRMTKKEMINKIIKEEDW